MSITVGGITDMVSSVVADDDPQFREDVRTYINQVCRRVWHRHRWPERRMRDFIQTTALVSMTDATATVSSTAFSTASSAPFTDTATDKDKHIAASVSGPFSLIATVTDTDNIVLADAWLEAAITAGNAVMYKDWVDLPGTLYELDRIFAHADGDRYEMNELSGPNAQGYGRFPTTARRPESFYFAASGDVNVSRIKFFDAVPDAVYNLEVLGWSKWTDKTEPSQKLGLPEYLEEVIIEGVKQRAYERDHFRRSVEAGKEYYRLLTRAWSERNESDQGFQLGERGTITEVPDLYIDPNDAVL